MFQYVSLQLQIAYCMCQLLKVHVSTLYEGSGQFYLLLNKMAKQLKQRFHFALLKVALFT
jgi:hypothetical protein